MKPETNITLEQFNNMFVGIEEAPKIYVFDNEEYWSNFIYNEALNFFEILFTIQSDLKLNVYLADKFCKSNVINFCAIDVNKIAVLIDTKK